MNKKIYLIIVPCALLSKSKEEIERFQSFRFMLDRINSIKNQPKNIKWVFCETYIDTPKLEKTIISRVKNLQINKNFLYCSLQNNAVDQIKIWNYVVANFEFDFVIFTHSDILFSSNLYDVINSRIIDIDKNYYAFRFDITKYQNFGNIDDIKKQKINDFYDFGFKYVKDTVGLKYCSYFEMAVPSQLSIYSPKHIPESFIAMSKKSFNRIGASEFISYHNDVLVRDISAINRIDEEWLNDELILLHLRGIDDAKKTIEKDNQIQQQIIEKYPQLWFYSLFRYDNRFNTIIDKNRDKAKYIFENYIDEKMQTINQDKLRCFLYEK
jgi:hypothetical protein